MDLYNPSWLHHQQPHPHIQESSPHLHHEGRHTSTDDWKDRVTPTGHSTGAASPPPTQPPALDLSDFGLGNITGKRVFERSCERGQRFSSSLQVATLIAYHIGSSPSGSSSISPPPQPFYGNSFQANNFFLPSAVPGPFNAMAYGAGWSNQSSQVPLSNYSSLNGATTGSAGSSSSSLSQQQQQQQQQQSQQSPPPQMMIEYVDIQLILIYILIST
jgi:protein phosphatase 1 regulatory subunit 10